jgi:RNA polymerase sigma factor (TIGR02999 family)
MPGDVTRLLIAWQNGSQEAGSQLMDFVYSELKQLAHAYLRREPAAHSLASTGLVHEAYLRLVDQRRVDWQNRHHFFGIAAQAMRRILVDRARAASAAKRGGDAVRVELSEHDLTRDPLDVDVLALDRALLRLEKVEPRWSRVVELRYFAGFSIEETAEALSLSPASVKRDWSLARAWLYREISTGSA